MAKREAFLMRVDPEVLAALRLWARDELRSVNAQLEFVLRRALADAGRLKTGGPQDRDQGGRGPGGRGPGGRDDGGPADSG